LALHTRPVPQEAKTLPLPCWESGPDCGSVVNDSIGSDTTTCKDDNNNSVDDDGASRGLHQDGNVTEEEGLKHHEAAIKVDGGEGAQKVNDAFVGDVGPLSLSSGVPPLGRANGGGGAMIGDNRKDSTDGGEDTAVSVRAEALFGASEVDREEGVSSAGEDEGEGQSARWEQQVLSALAEMRKVSKEQSIKLAEQVRQCTGAQLFWCDWFLTTVGVSWRRCSSERCVHSSFPRRRRSRLR